MDVIARRVIMHHEPEGDRYRQRRLMRFGSTITAATIDALVIDTTGLA